MKTYKYERRQKLNKKLNKKTRKEKYKEGKWNRDRNNANISTVYLMILSTVQIMKSYNRPEAINDPVKILILSTDIQYLFRLHSRSTEFSNLLRF